MEIQRTYKKHGKIMRDVTIEAVDMKKGMTAGELMDIMLQCPPDIVPVCYIRMNGAVKSVRLTMEVVPDA